MWGALFAVSRSLTRSKRGVRVLCSATGPAPSELALGASRPSPPWPTMPQHGPRGRNAFRTSNCTAWHSLLFSLQTSLAAKYMRAPTLAWHPLMNALRRVFEHHLRERGHQHVTRRSSLWCSNLVVVCTVQKCSLPRCWPQVLPCMRPTLPTCPRCEVVVGCRRLAWLVLPEGGCAAALPSIRLDCSPLFSFFRAVARPVASSLGHSPPVNR